MARFPAMMTATALPFLGKMSSEHALNDSKVQQFIHRNDLYFDVVINEDTYHESLMMFGHKFKAPIVTLGKFSHICIELICFFYTNKANLPRTVTSSISITVNNTVAGLCMNLN